MVKELAESRKKLKEAQLTLARDLENFTEINPNTTKWIPKKYEEILTCYKLQSNYNSNHIRGNDWPTGGMKIVIVVCTEERERARERERERER